MSFRRFFLLAAGVAIAGPTHAQNNQVLIGPEPAWAHPSEPLPVPADASGLIYVRKRDSVVHLDANGQTSYTGFIIKILNSQALELGNVDLTWNPSSGAPTVHALRIHRDGAVINVLDGNHFEILRREDHLEQARLDGLLTAVLRIPDLRVGDELEVAFTTPSNDPTLGNQSFGVLALESSPPGGRFHIGLDWMQGQEPKVQLTPMLTALVTRKPGTLDITFDDPKIVTPPKDAPMRYAWQRVLEYTDFNAWSDVSQRFYQLFAAASRLNPDSPLKAEAARIAAGHPGKLAQAQAALELVQQQVRYIYVGLGGGNYNPAAADETWRRRYGDCKGKSALLLALLRELGIEAEPVLANNSGLDDGLDARLPSPGLFDHVLVRARIEGASYWLDGTLPAVARADTVPVMPYRWVLPLAANGGKLEALPWKPLNQPESIQVYDMDAREGFGKPARIVLTTIQRGLKGLAEYVQLSAVTKDQLTTALRGQLTGSSSWNSVDSVDYRYDAASHASILKITGSGPVNWENDGGERYLSLPGGGFSPPERLQRATDQDQQAPFFREPTYDCDITTVQLPSDTGAGKWSFNTSINSLMYGRRYYRTWHQDGGSIQMIRGLRTEELEVPAAEAQRDSARLSAFDNSMARITYNASAAAPTTAARAPLPTVDWTAPTAGCLPPGAAR